MEGLEEKLKIPAFNRLIAQHDILGLVVTWTSDDNNLFSWMDKHLGDARRRPRNSIRNSDGLLVLIKDTVG